MTVGDEAWVEVESGTSTIETRQAETAPLVLAVSVNNEQLTRRLRIKRSAPNGSEISKD